jgi:steroid delta-isomerase-like uncharacterized protein
MTTESNKAFMQRFTQFINTASEELAGELISADAIFYVPGRAEPMRGPAGYLAIIGMMRGGFPDIQWTLEETIAEDDKVAARFTMRATHKGTFYGVPPTGKKIEVKAMNIYRFSNDKILEEHGSRISLGYCNKSARCRRRLPSWLSVSNFKTLRANPFLARGRGGDRPLRFKLGN